MRLGAARAGDLRAAGSAAWVAGRAARPKSKPSRFPQRHVRLRSLCASGTRRKHSDPLESLSCSAACWLPQIAQCWDGRARLEPVYASIATQMHDLSAV